MREESFGTKPASRRFVVGLFVLALLIIGLGLFVVNNKSGSQSFSAEEVSIRQEGNKVQWKDLNGNWQDLVSS